MYIHHVFFIHPSVHGSLGGFHVVAAVNRRSILLVIFILLITNEVFLHLVLKDERKFEEHLSEIKPQQEDPLRPPDTRHLLPYMSRSG